MHARQHPVTSRLGGVGLLIGVHLAGCLRHCPQQSSLGQGQFLQRLAKIVERCGAHTVVTATKIDLIEVKFEDIALFEHLLQTIGDERFPDLALAGALITDQHVLHNLLGDR